ncbi:hypothetical protein CDAR_402301 [Caerostris darwini]|uniref:Uncharacterized protein n=1 Tax=Caerostris darwini TaxID=1538125 RepID=A0AAV4P7H7_9ARAC|nr:hypothetical protein CDAR_402301 [Caerostris darwini]
MGVDRSSILKFLSLKVKRGQRVEKKSLRTSSLLSRYSAKNIITSRRAPFESDVENLELEERGLLLLAFMFYSKDIRYSLDLITEDKRVKSAALCFYGMYFSHSLREVVAT